MVLHGCAQEAVGFATDAGWTTFADQHGLALLLPEQCRKNNHANCFNWFQPEHSRRGHGEALTDAWANLYAEAGLMIAARRSGSPIPDGLTLSGAAEGLAGMQFIDACADSHEAGGAWTDCRLDL